MRVPSAASRGTTELNLTPMIDVVFQLIVFFLLSSHLAQQELQLELSLPRAGTGREAQQQDAERVVVNVTPGGQILLAGEPVEPVELGRRVAFENRRAGGELQVRIRGDRQVHYRFVEPILLECARAGVWNVSFAVLKDD